MKTLPVVVLLSLLAACSDSKESVPATESVPESSQARTPDAQADAPADALAVLRTHIATLQDKPEHTEAKVTVQHCLVGVANPRMPQVSRTPAEAEALAAELYARIQGGADFDQIVQQHTDDSHPGIYTMTLGAPGGPGEYPRGGMARAFGDTGWRLAVGEVGVAPFDPGTSPFGYHIIKRVR